MQTHTGSGSISMSGLAGLSQTAEEKYLLR